MEQRDYLKDQIEQMALVIAKIISGFFGMKSKNQASLGIEMANQAFQRELNINVESLAALCENDFKTVLLQQGFKTEHLEAFAVYFKELGECHLKTDALKAKNYLLKAREMLDVAGEISKTWSLQREKSYLEIEELLKR